MRPENIIGTTKQKPNCNKKPQIETDYLLDTKSTYVVAIESIHNTNYLPINDVKFTTHRYQF